MVSTYFAVLRFHSASAATKWIILNLLLDSFWFNHFEKCYVIVLKWKLVADLSINGQTILKKKKISYAAQQQTFILLSFFLLQSSMPIALSTQIHRHSIYSCWIVLLWNIQLGLYEGTYNSYIQIVVWQNPCLPSFCWMCSSQRSIPFKISSVDEWKGAARKYDSKANMVTRYDGHWTLIDFEQ